MSIEIILFITGIIIIAYGIFGWKLKVDFKGIKIEVIGELYQWQRYTLFLLGIVCIAVAYLLARGSLLPKEMVAESGSGEGSSVMPIALPSDMPSGTIEPNITETVPEIEPYVYDGFDDPAYDGFINTRLWYLIDPDCGLAQQAGFILMKNECSIEVSRPSRVRGKQLESIEARLRQPSDNKILEDEGISTVIKAIVDFDNGWWEADCGTYELLDWLGVRFLVYDTRLGTEFEENNLYITDYPIDHDRWYQVLLQVDPETMKFECLVDGVVIGSFTPENTDELRDVFFKRWLDTGGNTQAVTQVDYFRLIPAYAVNDQ